MFKEIRVRPATIQITTTGRCYIKAKQRVYIEALDNHSSLISGYTNYFNKNKTKVKRIVNYL